MHTISTETLQAITIDQAWHYRIIPTEISADRITFYTDEKNDLIQLNDELEVLLDRKIQLVKYDSLELNSLLVKYYRKGKRMANEGKSFNIKENENDFLKELITEANDIDSSDIHIESYEGKCRVRMRIDGKLVERYIIKKSDYQGLINKIKIQAQLDIAEKRLPQDGRIYFQNINNKFDLRVSVLPTLYGEKIVLRLLSKDATQIDLDKLGFHPEQLTEYIQGVRKPHGIVLISGPTGSGKTTTLYASLKLLNQETENIITIEDPIEYTLDGINQVQLKEDIGLTFERALRTFLRQDPDIIMLGEIRDEPTAHMAVRAALTGHLVLSTIHTNSAWGTISRLLDMGIPPFLLANTLNLSVAQRLVRLLCPNCKIEEPFDNKLYPKIFKPKLKLVKHYRAGGCDKCYYTGFRGRTAIYEIISIDEELGEYIKENQLNTSIALKNKNITTLQDAAFKLFANGYTSIEEIYSILMHTK